MESIKKGTKVLLLSILLSIFTYSAYAQADSSKVVVISAKNLYEGLKNKSLKFNYNQEIEITGVLKETGSSIIYNSAYLLISDKENGHIYVKAVLADKKKRNEYKNGQNIKIRCRFYEERKNVVVVKDARNK
jgi:hypothetical protein